MSRISRGRRLALGIVCAATLMAIVDETVVAVALPSIQRVFDLPSRALSWVVDLPPSPEHGLVRPLGFFRDREVVGVNAAHALMVGAMFGFEFLMTLYLQRVLGFSAAEAGLGLLPVALGIGTFSMVAFPRGRRVRLAYPAGLTAVSAGMALLVRVPVDGSYVADVLPSALLFALGGGFVLPAAVTLGG